MAAMWCRSASGVGPKVGVDDHADSGGMMLSTRGVQVPLRHAAQVVSRRLWYSVGCSYWRIEHGRRFSWFNVYARVVRRSQIQRRVSVQSAGAVSTSRLLLVAVEMAVGWQQQVSSVELWRFFSFPLFWVHWESFSGLSRGTRGIQGVERPPSFRSLALSSG